MYREKPWWLRVFTDAGIWVTIYPWVNVPVGIKPESRPEICLHENVHLERQREMGVWKWLWRYFTDRRFRLDEECMGIAAEVMVLSISERVARISSYAWMLAGSSYHHAAGSVEEGRAAILAAIDGRLR